MCLPHAVPPRPEGRTRRHEREAEMRWTLAASVRRMMLRTDGEGVWSWHPWAGAKSAGDDLQATVTMRSRTPGRARTTPLTPLRREGRVAPVEPVVTNSCAFYTAHEAAGATSIRSSLRPLFSRDTAEAKLGCKSRRESADTCASISSLRAKRSNPESPA
jgi:hypothetical protein